MTYSNPLFLLSNPKVEIIVYPFKLNIKSLTLLLSTNLTSIHPYYIISTLSELIPLSLIYFLTHI